MKPIGLRQKAGVTTFIYRFSDLREFINQGFKTGDVGTIIISRDRKGMIKHKGFGTIEHPVKTIMTITIKHNPFFDGKWDPARMIAPVTRNDREMQSYRYEIINFN